MKLYLSGPMSGVPDYNRPLFDEVAKVVRAMGFDVVNPIELDSGDTSQTWEYYLRRDIPILMSCGGIALLPKWEESGGASLEAIVAISLGLDVYTVERFPVRWENDWEVDESKREWSLKIWPVEKQPYLLEAAAKRCIRKLQERARAKPAEPVGKTHAEETQELWINAGQTWGEAQEQEARRRAFEEHLKKCSEEVRTWPQWKQEILGGTATEKPKDPPIVSVEDGSPAWKNVVEPPANILQEAERLIHGDRRKAYGHPLDDYQRTAKLWSGILGREVQWWQAMLCMVAVKLARLAQNPEHRDSMIDLAGYAGCLELSWQEQNRRHDVEAGGYIQLEQKPETN